MNKVVHSIPNWCYVITYKLQTSTSGPYSRPGMKSSGAAYSGLPQCVWRRLPGFVELLRPKSKGDDIIVIIIMEAYLINV